VNQISADIIIVSDIHIVHMLDARGKALLGFISEIDKANTLVLTGDIFDFCVGSRKHFRKKFESLGNALELLIKNGVRVVFVEGNHEFQMKKIGWQGVEFFDGRGLEIKTSDGQMIRFCHGDLIAPTVSYLVFRSFLKSWLTQTLCLLFSARWLDDTAISYAENSRRTHKSAGLNHRRVVDNASLLIKSTDCRHIVFGHFHTPYAEPVGEKHGLVLSVESWKRPNALIVKDGKFFRYYPIEGEDVILHETLPFLKKV